MGNLIGVVVFTIVIGLLAYKLEDYFKKDMKEEKTDCAIKEEVQAQITNINIGTRDLFLATLTKIGCQYQLGEGEDDSIYFPFQGERFIVDASNDSMFIHVWDPYWKNVELYDVDEVARIRKAINTANLNTPVTTLYTINEAGRTMDVHSRATIPFFSVIPDLETYLRDALAAFFHAHQVVGTEMHKMREEENV